MTIEELLEYTGFYYCHILVKKRFCKNGFPYPLGGGYRDKIIARYGHMPIDTCSVTDNALIIYVI